MLNHLIAQLKTPSTQPEANSEPSLPVTASDDSQPLDLSPRALALRAAKAAGWNAGDKQIRAKILRHQPSRMFLLVEVEDWKEPVICHVKDAQSWLPVNPPFDTLDARFCGTATSEGKLLFESSDLCKAGRLRRQAR
jgi:hypothetical protein